MTVLLKDLHLADALVAQYRVTDDSLKTLRAAYHEKVFRKHHIDRKQFEENFSYYLSFPSTVDSMYQLMETDLNERLIRMNNPGIYPAAEASQPIVADSGESETIQLNQP